MRFFKGFRANRALIATVLAVPAALLAGCGAGTIALSGPESTPTQVPVNVKGTVHGGQQALSFSTVQLWAVGSTGYGSGATEMTKAPASGTNEYYPGGTTGCNPTADTLTAYTVLNGTATFTTANTLIVGQLVQIADSGPLNGVNAAVTAVTPATFSVTTALSNSAGTDTGTATPICYTRTTTDINGNFTLSGAYTLPGPAAQTYITATGGNPGLTPASTNNTAIKLVSPLGLSSAIGAGTTVTVNEATTAAMAFAAGQYFTPTFGVASLDGFGSTSTTQGQLGLTNALATVNSLIGYPSGLPLGAHTLGNASTGTVVATPDTAKLALVADILASCVNSSSATSSSCAALFGDTAPSGKTAPTDTLQAAVYMSLNPSSNTSSSTSNSSTNVAALFALETATSPFIAFQTTYTSTAMPTDWSVAISYGTATANSSSVYPIDEAEWFAFDASGDLWILDYGTSNLSELSPTGVPQPVTAGIIGATTPYSVIVDTNGNVWMTNGYAATNNLGSAAPKQVIEYTPSNSSYHEVATTNAAYGLAADGKGDVFVLEGAANTVEEIAPGATTVTPVASSGMTLAKYSQIAIDSNYNLWITSGGSNTNLYEIPYSSGSYGTPIVSVNAAISEGEPLAIDGSNNIWVGNYVSAANGTAAKIPASAPTTGTAYTVTGATGGLEGVAIDGAGSVWVSNYSTSTNGFYDLANSGAQLSPTTGYAHTTHDGKQIAVDPSGNVWIGGTGTNTSTTALVELVGGAVPVVTPIAAGLPTSSGGTNSLGSKP